MMQIIKNQNKTDNIIIRWKSWHNFTRKMDSFLTSGRTSPTVPKLQKTLGRSFNPSVEWFPIAYRQNDWGLWTGDLESSITSPGLAGTRAWEPDGASFGNRGFVSWHTCFSETLLDPTLDTSLRGSSTSLRGSSPPGPATSAPPTSARSPSLSTPWLWDSWWPGSRRASPRCPRGSWCGPPSSRPGSSSTLRYSSSAALATSRVCNTTLKLEQLLWTCVKFL